MILQRTGICAMVTMLLLGNVVVTHARQDWPMYRGDAARSAFTANTIPAKLELTWKRTANHEPSPAWSAQPRLEYDHTYHPVFFDGLLFFGSSSDNKVYALDAMTGKTVWTHFTDAPIHAAPAVSAAGVCVGSDDGVLYCLDVKTGKLNWKVRAAPADDRFVGNDRLVSRWPVRGGPAIHQGVVYFTAGIWPTEGVYIYALDARDGKVVWKNDAAGSLISDKPRAGRDVKSGPAGQGHVAIGAGVMVVPTGRGAPAVFNLKDGSFEYFHHAVYVNKASGGTKAAVYDPFIVCGENYPGSGRGSKTRVAAVSDGANVAAAINAVHADHPKMLITGASSGLAGFAKTADEKERKERNGDVTKYLAMSREPVWQCATPFAVRDIVASKGALVIGGEGEIAVVDIKTKEVRSRAKLDGKVQSLAVANGCVYAATEDGSIYCFSDNAAGLENLKAPRGRVVALAAQTGQVKWQSEDNVGFGEMVAVSTEYNALMMSGDGKFAVFDATTGKPRWDTGGRRRPMVYGKELRFDSRVVDLLTGKSIRSISGVRGSYCTPILGSPKLIAFRVGVIGYVDVTAERGTEYFGGIRPGCYVDMTPAGGLLVMSDGASGCTCSYLNQCTIALQPRRSR